MDSYPFKSINSIEAVGLELWSITESILFDNFLITDDEKVAEEFALNTWKPKSAAEAEARKAVEKNEKNNRRKPTKANDEKDEFKIKI